MKTKKPSKQRRRLYKGKLHERKNVLTAHLSKELRKETGKRSLMVRKGDKVKIIRGQHKKKEGKIVRVNHKKAKIFIEKITRKKADGTERLIPFKASNLVLVELERKDDKRLKKAKPKKEETKPVAKQPFLEKKVATQTKSLSAQQNQDFVSEQKKYEKKEEKKEASKENEKKEEKKE